MTSSPGEKIFCLHVYCLNGTISNELSQSILSGKFLFYQMNMCRFFVSFYYLLYCKETAKTTLAEDDMQSFDCLSFYSVQNYDKVM